LSESTTTPGSRVAVAAPSEGDVPVVVTGTDRCFESGAPLVWLAHAVARRAKSIRAALGLRCRMAISFGGAAEKSLSLSRL
jgi:hypothetical protein